MISRRTFWLKVGANYTVFQVCAIIFKSRMQKHFILCLHRINLNSMKSNCTLIVIQKKNKSVCLGQPSSRFFPSWEMIYDTQEYLHLPYFIFKIKFYRKKLESSFLSIIVSKLYNKSTLSFVIIYHVKQGAWCILIM
jgi:hypothetical protein